MKQEAISKMLKGYTVFTAILICVFFFVAIPLAVNFQVKMIPEIDFLRWPAIIGMGVIGGICLYALSLFWKICKEIQYKNSFCKDNVRGLKNIGHSAIGVGTLILIGAFYLAIVGYLHPGIIIISLFFIFLAVTFAIICYALSGLLSNAVKLKEENDLTI